MGKERHESRFNSKRIGYTLKTIVTAFTGRDGAPGHVVKTNTHDATSPSSSLGWNDTTIVGRFSLPGAAKLTTQEESITLTADSGASVTRYADGSMVYAASLTSPVSGRERLRREQMGLPWFERAREAIENEYISEAGSLVDTPAGGMSKQKNTPYTRFQLAIPVSETETKTVDCYAYGQAIGIVNRRKLKKNDVVRVRASVQFHEQRLPGGRSTFVPWLRLFDVQRIK